MLPPVLLNIRRMVDEIANQLGFDYLEVQYHRAAR